MRPGPWHVSWLYPDKIDVLWKVMWNVEERVFWNMFLITDLFLWCSTTSDYFVMQPRTRWKIQMPRRLHSRTLCLHTGLSCIQVVRKRIDGNWDYTCCLGEGTGGKCGDWQFLGPVSVSILALGLTGALALAVKCKRAASAEKPLETSTILDGAHLHRTVPQDMWCVTLADLQQFKQLVIWAVLKGKIKPTDRDQFLVSEARCCIGICGWNCFHWFNMFQCQYFCWLSLTKSD